VEKLTKILTVLLLCFAISGLTGIIKADVPPPTQQTTFYFQQNGQPITQPIKFSIKCYGTLFLRERKGVVEVKDTKISELSENCLSYGCKIDTSNLFDVYTGDVRYCALEGELNDQKFKIDKFLGENLSELNCRTTDFKIITNGRYYRETSQYRECVRNVYKEYYPQGNGKVEGFFLCDKYKTEDRLIPTNISTEPNGPCYRYGYLIKNSVCYKIPQAFFDCTASEDRKIKACDKYLEDVTEKLAKDKNGRPFEKICEAKVEIPVNIQKGLLPNVQPTSNRQVNGNILNKIISLIKCAFLKILSGKSC